VTGLSRAQRTRWIRQHRQTGSIRDHRGAPARPFARRYTREDLLLLADVDEVTRFQPVGSVERISERFLLPVLGALLAAFPFVLQGFHADIGSEYINHRVAELLPKLHIGELTQSWARRTHENALAESKDGSVVRRHLGYMVTVRVAVVRRGRS